MKRLSSKAVKFLRAWLGGKVGTGGLIGMIIFSSLLTKVLFALFLTENDPFTKLLCRG